MSVFMGLGAEIYFGILATTVSNAAGYYSFTVTGGGSYVVTATWPSAPRYVLTGPQTFSNVNANVSQNFTATFTSGGSFSSSTPNKEYIFMNGAVIAVEHPQ